VSVRSVKKLDEGARNRFSSSRLAQLLQQWQVLEPLAAGPALPEQLARWLDWTDAVSLSSVLAGESPGHASPEGPAGASQPRAVGRSPTPTLLRQGLTQVRDGLLAAIATDPLFTAAGTATDTVDFAACRRQYQAHQRAMERQLGPWREAVRALLTRQAAAQDAVGGLGELAALDAVMERALAERESHLLSRLPLALERHFKRLAPDHGPGQAAFIKDLQALLGAELEFRLELIEGMLEALESPAPREMAWA
jgi:Protein of unknown function (DUF3348)